MRTPLSWEINKHHHLKTSKDCLLSTPTRAWSLVARLAAGRAFELVRCLLPSRIPKSFERHQATPTDETEHSLTRRFARLTNMALTKIQARTLVDGLDRGSHDRSRTTDRV